MRNSGKIMYQYFIMYDVGVPCSSGALTPGRLWAPCERGKNLRPMGGFVWGSRVGIVMPRVAVSYEIEVMNVGASVRASNSEHLGAKGETRGVYDRETASALAFKVTLSSSLY
jgi:hypothetical protein